MRENSIVRFITETQYAELKQIYCPMCEIVHINDTNCQRND